jgi:hypothetical protein
MAHLESLVDALEATSQRTPSVPSVKRQEATAASDDFIATAAAAVKTELPRHIVRQHTLDPANVGIFHAMYSGSDESTHAIGKVRLLQACM